VIIKTKGYSMTTHEKDYRTILADIARRAMPERGFIDFKKDGRSGGC
jgi:hypothetical protein